MTYKPVLPLRAAYAFAESNKLAEEMAPIKNMTVKYPRYYSTVKRAYVADLFEKHGLLTKFIRTSWRVGQSDASRMIEFYRRKRRDFERTRTRWTGRKPPKHK